MKHKGLVYFLRALLCIVFFLAPSFISTLLSVSGAPLGGLLILALYGVFFYLCFQTAKGKIGPQVRDDIPETKADPSVQETVEPVPAIEQTAWMGKQVSRRARRSGKTRPAAKNVLLICLTVLTAAGVGTSVWLGILYQKAQTQIEDLEWDLSMADIRISRNEEQLDEYKAQQQEYIFWHRNAVIVTTGGEKYHQFDCQYVKGHEFRIYDRSTAEARGYERCSVCCGYTGGWLRNTVVP